MGLYQENETCFLQKGFEKVVLEVVLYKMVASEKQKFLLYFWIGKCKRTSRNISFISRTGL